MLVFDVNEPYSWDRLKRDLDKFKFRVLKRLIVVGVQLKNSTSRFFSYEEVR